MIEPEIVRDKRDDGVTWRVVASDETSVTVSGPGPCRSLKILSREEFDEWWEEVN